MSEESTTPQVGIPVPADVSIDVNKTPKVKKAYQYALVGTAVGAIIGIIGKRNVFYSALWGLAGGTVAGFFFGKNKKVTDPIDAAIAEAKAAIDKGEKLSEPLIVKLKAEYNKMVAAVPQGTTPPADVVAKANTVQTIIQVHASQTTN